MNQFIFCVIVDDEIHYGTFQAQDGRDARDFMERTYPGRRFELKGVASKAFDSGTMLREENQ